MKTPALKNTNLPTLARYVLPPRYVLEAVSVGRKAGKNLGQKVSAVLQIGDLGGRR